MVTILENARDAMNRGDVDAAYGLALRVMIKGGNDEAFMRAKSIYAWALSKKGQLGEALQLFRELQAHYVREDMKLSFIEALMIMKQVQILRELMINAAADGLLDNLVDRIQRETNGDVTHKIVEKLNTILNVSITVHTGH